MMVTIPSTISYCLNVALYCILIDSYAATSAAKPRADTKDNNPHALFGMRISQAKSSP